MQDDERVSSAVTKKLPEQPGYSFAYQDLTKNRLGRGNYTTLAFSYDAKTIYFAFAERAAKKPDWFTNGFDFSFSSVTLAPGAVLVVVENEAAFAAIYSDFSGTIAGQYSGHLSNGGETIELRDATDAVIQTFAYQDNWHPSTDSDGYSLTNVDPVADPSQWNHPNGWLPGSSRGGSPGEDDS